jgi:hypothetical protein
VIALQVQESSPLRPRIQQQRKLLRHFELYLKYLCLKNSERQRNALEDRPSPVFLLQDAQLSSLGHLYYPGTQHWG